MTQLQLFLSDACPCLHATRRILVCDVSMFVGEFPWWNAAIMRQQTEPWSFSPDTIKSGVRTLEFYAALCLPANGGER